MSYKHHRYGDSSSYGNDDGDATMNDVLRSLPIVLALVTLAAYLFPGSVWHKRCIRLGRHCHYMALYVVYVTKFYYYRFRDAWDAATNNRRGTGAPTTTPDRPRYWTRRQQREALRPWPVPFQTFVARHKFRMHCLNQTYGAAGDKGKGWSRVKQCAFSNFTRGTAAHFTPCRRPLRAPDFKSPRSWYWDVRDVTKGSYVIRSSDHWSNKGHMIRNNWWTYDTRFYKAVGSKDGPDQWLTGMCRYQDMEFFISYKITFDNFYRCTVAHYRACEMPGRPPDFVSPSGSAYWDVPEEAAVIRRSDHWSNTGRRIADCWWTYEDAAYTMAGDVLVGKCPYADFLRHRGHPETPSWGTMAVNTEKLHSGALTPGTSLSEAYQQWKTQCLLTNPRRERKLEARKH